MKTRLDTILETVSFILEVKRKSTKGMRTRDRAAALIHRAGGLGTEMSDRILARLDPTVQKEVKRDIRQGEQDLDDDNRGRWQRENR
jgi:hypothetical protein